MNSQEALKKIMDVHTEYLFAGETKAPYPVGAIEALINAMGSMAQGRPSGDTLSINQNASGTRVSVKGEKNSKSFNWELRVEEVARGAEDLIALQARVEAAFEGGFKRMSEKYGAPNIDKKES